MWYLFYMDTVNLTEENKGKIIATMRSFGAVVGYLFGSYARETAGLRSDIDVAVAFPHEISSESQENRVENIRNGLEKIFGADKVDVVNVGAVKNPLLLYLIVLGEGEILFSDDIPLKNNIAMRALREFEDTKYLRNIQSASLNNLFLKN